MRLYHILSRFPLINRNYSAKFLLVAFLGVHLPLVALLLLFLASDKDSFSQELIFSVALGTTLLATAITLYLLSKLLKPILYVNEALDTYLKSFQLSNLPTNYEDEAGHLLKNMSISLKYIEENRQDTRDLISLISHDLRGPVNNVIGISNLIQNHGVTEKEYISLIKSEAERTLLFLDSVLKLLKDSQEEFNHHEIQKIELKSLVQTLVLNHFMSLEHKSIKVNSDIPERIYIRADSELISSAIGNLLSNAIKFSNPGSSIDITANQSNAKVVLSIRDHGIGMSEEVMNLLFQRFSKARRPGTQNENSTGLGLYLSKRILERFGARIYAKSEGEGKGSEFVLEFDV